MKKMGLTGFVFGVLAIFYFFIVNHSQKNPQKETKNTSFFVSVPIIEFTSTGIPCLNVEIQGKNYIAKLDLGSNNHASIKSELLKNINEKYYIKSEIIFGWKGNQYEQKLYEIPQVKIGKMTISRIFLYEENANFTKDSVILSNKNESLYEAQGKLGWKLFCNINLFLNIANSQIAFCDSIKTLRSNGYLTNSFVKVPILLDNDLIEMDTLTANGPLRCFLDTGFTWNVLNTENQNNETMEEMALNEKNVFIISSLKIARKEFGPITFHTFPIKMPFKIEAVLGMEFFREHLVFLDFANGYAYIAKCKKD